MNDLSAFAISASGMNAEKTRLDVIAVNIANINSTRGATGALFKPLRVVSTPKNRTDFAGMLTAASGDFPLGVEVSQISQTDVPPRLVYEPSHPAANAKGYVEYPGINFTSEMVSMMSAIRAYEANVVAMNAAKSMALKALDIGGNA